MDHVFWLVFYGIVANILQISVLILIKIYCRFFDYHTVLIVTRNEYVTFRIVRFAIHKIINDLK